MKLQDNTERFFGDCHRFLAVVHNGRVYVADANQRGIEYTSGGIKDWRAKMIVDWRADRFNSWSAFFRYFAGSQGLTLEALEPIDDITPMPSLPAWLVAAQTPRRLARGSDLSIADIKALAKEAGSHWFDRSSMRFFGSRVLSSVYADQHDPDRYYFVSSEQFIDSRGNAGPRLYSVRSFCRSTGDIDTVGKFQSYTSAREARRAAQTYANMHAAPVDLAAAGFDDAYDLYHSLVQVFGYDDPDHKWYMVEAGPEDRIVWADAAALEAAQAHKRAEPEAARTV